MKKRNYKQNCSLAYAADFLGERWTLLLLRELLIQPCRFKELNLWLKGMGTNLIATRLKELEQDGLIEKQQPLNKRSAYQLTSAGMEVESVILPMIRWGYLRTETQPDYIHYDHWDLLAMKAFFNLSKGKKEQTIQFIDPSLTASVSVSKSGFNHRMGINKNCTTVINSNIKQFQQGLANGIYTDDKPIDNFIAWFEVPARQ